MAPGNCQAFVVLINFLWMCASARAQATSKAVCYQRVARGPCEAELTRWHYDYTLGRCKSFEYSGCGGNGNRFATKEDCQRDCEDLIEKNHRAAAENRTALACSVPRRQKYDYCLGCAVDASCVCHPRTARLVCVANDRLKGTGYGSVFTCDELENDELGTSNLVCCNGRLAKMRTKNAGCCNNEPYNRNQRLCCDGNLYYRGSNSDCCGGLPYNARTQLCCDGAIYMKGMYQKCCGRSPIRQNQNCCNNQVSTSPLDDSCCQGRSPYNSRHQKCCWNGQVVQRSSISCP